MFKKTHKTRYIRVFLKARTWKEVPMKLLKWKKKMTSKEQEYDLVTNDEYDTRIPLHSDEAFTYGIKFEAKYIGTMDVPRPTSRVEIVAAMRRVRYEFKARGVKKRKVTMDVSIDGVHVTTVNKSVSKKRTMTFFGRKTTTIIENVELMHHPIYRIFYVSHDSSDLKIFSYIARDGSTNGFKCNVFKSNKKVMWNIFKRTDFLKNDIRFNSAEVRGANYSIKSQAMRIVRTVGQAFEVCHKMQVNSPPEPVPSTSSAVDEPVPSCSDTAPSKEAASDCGASETASAAAHVEGGLPGGKEEPVRPTHLNILPPPPPPKKEGKKRIIPTPTINLPDLPECTTKADIETDTVENTLINAKHLQQLLHEKLEQQSQQTCAAVAQVMLMRNQLAAEQTARREAQARTQQLLFHNKELLEHIASLVSHLQERMDITSRPISAYELTQLPQILKFNANQMNRQKLIELFSPNNNTKQSKKTKRIRSPFITSPNPGTSNGAASDRLTGFEDISNEQIHDYLINKFEDMGKDHNQNEPPAKSTFNANQQFFQNCQAFPNIPPLVSHYSNSDLQNLLKYSVFNEPSGSGNQAQAMRMAQSYNSLCSLDSQDSSDSSKDSSDSSSEDGLSFIKPLSHNGTLTATGKDGRVRLIVPVSPSESVSDVGDRNEGASQGGSGAAGGSGNSGNTLKVPGTVAPNSPITRSTSEKVPNRSEMMTAMRQQWTRHTTK